ncbi:hypothetical protein [Lewinella sp. IMCC34183]|uniref:hypothetical protein n=1 Tax=Lewinella sp. IMCC34183 TaxID=2248762 RepID=UPI000E24D29E|nr:hypothetical protein [Lewinella sp. IMCC34183]
MYIPNEARTQVQGLNQKRNTPRLPTWHSLHQLPETPCLYGIVKILLLLFSCDLPQRFPAWGAHGHRIVAHIADENLNDAARQACEDAPQTWMEESVVLRERIYNTLYDSTDRETGLPDLGYDYQHNFLPTVEERLGAAALLSRILQ